MTTLSEWGDKEARDLTSDLLNPPIEGLRTRKVVLDKGKAAERTVELKQWDEFARVTFVGGPEPVDDDFASYGHEVMRLGFQQLGDYPSTNPKRLLPTDWLHVYSGLVNKTPEELKAKKDTGSPIEKKLYGRSIQMRQACQRVAKFLQALGHHGYLVDRKHFRGYNSILPIVPEFKNARLKITIEQGEGDDGVTRDKIVGYKALDD